VTDTPPGTGVGYSVSFGQPDALRYQSPSP